MDFVVRLIVTALAVGYLQIVYTRRERRLRHELAETRVDLMHLIRELEHRGNSAAQDALRGKSPGYQLGLLAGDLRTDFPDYFPTQSGGVAFREEGQRAGFSA